MALSIRLDIAAFSSSASPITVAVASASTCST